MEQGQWEVEVVILFLIDVVVLPPCDAAPSLHVDSAVIDPSEALHLLLLLQDIEVLPLLIFLLVVIDFLLLLSLRLVPPILHVMWE